MNNLCIEAYVQGAPRKELLIVAFVKRLKAATLGTSSYRYILPIFVTLYVNIEFLLNFGG